MTRTEGFAEGQGAQRGSRRKWLALRPYPFEIYTGVVFLASILFLRAFGLRMDWRTMDYTLVPMLSTLPMALGLGLLLQAVYHFLRRRRREDLLHYLRGLLAPGWWLLWIRLWLASMLMTYVYFWVKICIPLINPVLWDPQLWQLDRLLHLGLSPNVFAVELFRDSPLLSPLDAWYGVWVKTVMLTLAFFTAFVGRDLLRRRFMLSCCLLWTLGSWIYMALPALGPCYAVPEVFEGIRESMPAAEGGQEILWENYQLLLAGRETGVLRQFNPTRGVAALPSLHVAAHFLFLLWFRREVRTGHITPRLGRALLMVGGTLLGATVVGSVVTGWHYAIDAYLGLALAWGCYRLALRWERPPSPEPAPAP
jgi:hypothetical protein